MLLGTAGALWVKSPPSSSGFGNSQERQAGKNHFQAPGQRTGLFRSSQARGEFPPHPEPLRQPLPPAPLAPLRYLGNPHQPARAGSSALGGEAKCEARNRGRSGETKAKAGGGAGSEIESGRRRGIMAAAPLLVRLSPAPAAGEKANLKLQAYFQSGKRSGGGECNVRTGPKPGTYWVDFFKEQGTGRLPRL